MAVPTENKTACLCVFARRQVHARILKYAQEIGWRYVSRGDAEARRGFDPDGATPEDRARTASLYFGDLLHAQVRAFNPKYKEAQGALVGEFRRLNADIAGNLEAKVKSFCEVKQVLRFLKDFISSRRKRRNCKSSSCGSIRWAGRIGWWHARSTRSAPAAWYGTRRAAARPTR